MKIQTITTRILITRAASSKAGTSFGCSVTQIMDLKHRYVSAVFVSSCRGYLMD
jgi:hypothetical protein